MHGPFVRIVCFYLIVKETFSVVSTIIALYYVSYKDPTVKTEIHIIKMDELQRFDSRHVQPNV